MLKNIIKKNCYYDSVVLMSIAGKVKSVKGINEVSAIMGTEQNKNMLNDLGLITSEGKSAKADDLIIAISAKDESAIDNAIKEIENLLTSKETVSKTADTILPSSVEKAFEIIGEPNIAVISIPGPYVKREAKKIIERGCNTFIFSDNVSIADEVELKKLGREKGVLVMGPDCGTSIINGVALGFANAVKKGNIGIVGAAGTGIQEVSTIIAKNGCGISQAIGTGGRDLKDEVGGITMMQAISALENDKETDIIVLISKPPGEKVKEKILGLVKGCKKKFVIIILGSRQEIFKSDRIFFAENLEDAALKAVALAKDEEYFPKPFSEDKEKIIKLAKREWSKLREEQKYIRGLYSGGTLCDETMQVLSELVGDVYSNIPLKKDFKLKNSRELLGNCCVDLGDDEFTKGRPHPMIDYTLRNEFILKEASAQEVAVILLDVVLGFGAHPDPASVLVPTIKKAKEILPTISFVCSICGCEGDPQDYNKQKRGLESAGVIVMPSNVQSSRFSALVSLRGKVV